ncbi:MAG: Gmad2 immunoglobulin-like domain-containing protein [Acidimicrobiia bacterium]|jgi:hypothetical protein
MRSAPGRQCPNLLALVILVLSLGGCAGVAGPSTTIPTTAGTPATTPSTLPPPVECPGTGEFEEGGGIAEVEAESPDSSLLGNISWEVNDQCESFLFEFETSEGAPATSVPDIEVSHLESFQVIRIWFGVNSAVLTDQLVETGLVDRLYVVRSLNGGIFVDLHLSAPAAARASVRSSPATLTVDLRPGFVDFVGTSVVGDQVVLVSPPSGIGVSTSTQLTGYSRFVDPDVLIIVTQGDEVALETRAPAAESETTWGEFRADLDLPPGDVSVFIGEASSDDGSLAGIAIDLTVS